LAEQEVVETMLWNYIRRRSCSNFIPITSYAGISWFSSVSRYRQVTSKASLLKSLLYQILWSFFCLIRRYTTLQ